MFINHHCAIVYCNNNNINNNNNDYRCIYLEINKRTIKIK